MNSMNRPMLPRLGAACGIVFPIAMFLAVGDGNHFAPWRAVAATWALVLALPFLTYLCSLLRTAEGEGGWISPPRSSPASRGSCLSSQATRLNWRSTATRSQKARRSIRRWTTRQAPPP